MKQPDIIKQKFKSLLAVPGLILENEQNPIIRSLVSLSRNNSKTNGFFRVLDPVYDHQATDFLSGSLIVPDICFS